MSEVQLYLGDCLVEMSRIKDGSIDCICADLPYQTTNCAWDILIPFAPLWTHFKRVTKPRGAVVLFGSQPFTSALIMSNIEWFKYCWVWKKERPIGHLVAKVRPMQETEDIAVFGKEAINYYPIMKKRNKSTVERYKANGKRGSSEHMGFNQKTDYVRTYDYFYPRNILEFSSIQKLHPTQKPTSLLSYLIRTYTLQGETVLDCTMGSGSTGVACAETGRKFIGIERDETYFNIATKRIADAQRAAAGQPKQLTGHASDLDGAPLFSMMESV